MNVGTRITISEWLLLSVRMMFRADTGMCHSQQHGSRCQTPAIRSLDYLDDVGGALH
jgi:hypothetical protein